MESDPLQLWEVLEGVGLDRCNLIVSEVQILDGAKILSEKADLNDGESITILEHQAVEFWKIAQDLRRQEIYLYWTVEVDYRYS